DRARAARALDLVWDRRALEVDLEHHLPGVLGRLFDGAGDFVGLAIADADIATAIAGDDERAEAERSAALHDFRAAIDSDDGALDAAVVAAAATIVTPAAAST